MSNSYSPYQSPQPESFRDLPRGPETEALRQSGLGVASFVIAMLCGLTFFGALVVAGVVGLRAAEEGGGQPSGALMMMIGFAILGAMGLALLGGILGLVALFQSDRKRLFAVLGLILNLLVFLGIGGIFAVGVSMG